MSLVFFDFSIIAGSIYQLNIVLNIIHADLILSLFNLREAMIFKIL